MIELNKIDVETYKGGDKRVIEVCHCLTHRLCLLSLHRTNFQCVHILLVHANFTTKRN